MFFLGLALLVVDAASRRPGRPGFVVRFFATKHGTRGVSVLAVLALAAALLTQEGRGPAAWILAGLLVGGVFLAGWRSWIPRNGIAPALCAALSLGAAAGIRFVETVHHSDGQELARTVAKSGSYWDLSNAGDLLLARDSGGTAHQARITPDLVRAFRRERVHMGYQSREEFVAPGWAPLWVLAAALLVERLCSRGGATFYMRLAAVSGTIGFFFVCWTATAQAGLLAQGGFVHPDSLARYVLVLLSGGAFLRCIYVKMSASPLHERRGWAFSYFFCTLAAPVGVFLVTERTPHSPLLAGVLLFAGLGALAWERAVRPRPGEAA
jgi:hypothetical protein